MTEQETQLSVSVPLINTASVNVIANTARQNTLESTFNSLVINAGSSNAEIVVARGGKADLNTRLGLVDAQLAENASHQKISSKTYGTFDTAAVVGIIGNEPINNPSIQVLGVYSAQEASNYSGRDTVSLYISNRSSIPTVTVNSGVITYTANTVSISGITVGNLAKVLPGMLIDTYHNPNRYTSIVDSVDVANQIITVKVGWYLVQTGGSSTPSIPPNSIGFDINRTTKIWGINNNVFLEVGDSAKTGVAEEIGLFNHTSDGILSGVDLVNFSSKADFGFMAHPAAGNPNGFSRGYVSDSADSGFQGISAVSGNLILESLLNGDSIGSGFRITNSGVLSKLKLNASVFGNGATTYSDIATKIYFINKTLIEDFVLPTPIGKSGETIIVVNSGVAQATLKTESGNIVVGVGTTSVGILPMTVAIFVSDNSSWHAISGAFDNYKGYFKQSGGTISGDVSINGALFASAGAEIGSTTVAGTSFVDFHSSGSNIDYDVRLSVSGGSATIVGQGVYNISCGVGRATVNSQTIVTIKTGISAPTTAPDVIGQEYLDTTNKKSYKAFGISSSSDWVILN